MKVYLVSYYMGDFLGWEHFKTFTSREKALKAVKENSNRNLQLVDKLSIQNITYYRFKDGRYQVDISILCEDVE